MEKKELKTISEKVGRFIDGEQVTSIQNNYYIDNRTQVVVNQPTREVMVTSAGYDALMRAYKKAAEVICSQSKQLNNFTSKVVSLMMENKALRDEVRELKSRNYAIGEGNSNTETR